VLEAMNAPVRQGDLFAPRKWVAKKYGRMQPTPETVWHKKLVAIVRALVQPGVRFFYIANGAWTDERGGKTLIDMGLERGAFDLMFFRSGLTLGLELKSSDGEISDEQIAFGRDFVDADRKKHRWKVSRSLVHAVKLLVRLQFIFKPGRQ
jgi:hypothetical protein